MLRACEHCDGFGLERGYECPSCKGYGIREPFDAIAYTHLGMGRMPSARDGMLVGFETDRQSRRGSFVETLFSTAIGFVVALVTTAYVLPWFGHHVTHAENFWITSIFTVVSVVRGYCVRRLFEAWR